MKVLQICNKVPFPPMDGGAIAMYNIGEGLNNEGRTVEVFALNPNKNFVQNSPIPITVININTQVSFWGAFLNLFSRNSYNVERFYSKEVDSKLKEKLKDQKFDLVILESLFVCPYLETLRKYSNAKIILRAHNVEHLIWKGLAKKNNNFLLKTYYGYLAWKLKNYELKTIKKVDGIAAITDLDSKILRTYTSVPIITIPLGINLENYHCGSNPEENSLFHLGSMDWRPNIEAVDWFLNECWSRIHNELPELKLYLGGKNMPEKYFDISLPNLVVIGEVKNAKDFICSKKIMIVPLLSGSGMRVKIIEGMACEKVIISTSIGAEGIEYSDGENILIANTPEDFLKHLKLIYSNPQLAEKLGTNAKELIKSKYDNFAITQKLINFCNQIS